jgi:hypothetical protein
MLKAFETSNVIMHIIVISVFIGIFFFTYGAYLEKKILKNQLDYLVDDTLGSFKIFMPELSDNIKQTIKTYQFNLDPNADMEVKNSNKKIMKKAFIAIAIAFIIGILIIVVISKKLDMEGMTNKQFFTRLLKYNLFALIIIGLTEFIFASGFAQNYISLDLNRIKKQIVDNLIKLR